MRQQHDSVAVRRAEPADAPAVADFVHRLLQVVLPAHKVMPLAEVLAVTRPLLAEGNITAFLAEEDAGQPSGGQPVGLLTLTLMYAIFARGAFGEITELFVEPAWRSRAVGERLVEAAKAHGRALGWSRLELSGPHHDQPGADRAIAFYRRIGFAEVGPRMMIRL